MRGLSVKTAPRKLKRDKLKELFTVCTVKDTEYQASWAGLQAHQESIDKALYYEVSLMESMLWVKKYTDCYSKGLYQPPCSNGRNELHGMYN